MRRVRDYGLIFGLLAMVGMAVCLSPAQAQQTRVNVASATSTTSNLIPVIASILGIAWRATGTDGTIRISDSSQRERIVIFTPAAESTGFIPFPGEGVLVSGSTTVTLSNVDGITILYR